MAYLLQFSSEHHIIRSGDTASVASIMAYRLEPGLFEQDALFYSGRTSDFYQSAIMLIAYYYTKIGGDLGTFFLSLRFPFVLFQLLGFYLLGWRLTRNRSLAIIASIGSFPCMILVSGGIIWGPYEVPLLREFFLCSTAILNHDFIR